ncbi:serine/threonine-protein kinase [Polyangium spumosum]|uniref:Protein kinase n=1 Tax=Polyangium spumosum TaxID=889282 RepID=A0A6N7PLX1_9BACT|nr:serine/threonine-protein kinase [Polyangium spumosum]MRG91144.1 protein kinase [Polyangium spumosum]
MKSCPTCSLRYPSESSTCFADGSALVVLRDPWLGSTVAGRYVLDELIGIGGMASVYRARFLLTDRPCAVKLLNPQLASDATTRERFNREARLAQRLAHPNIIEIFDHGDAEDGTPFLVMELLEGESLSEIIAAGPVPLARALPIVVQMTRALARAHDFEVIHRDLKPENVFLLRGDRVKLLDFGIARCAQDVRLTNAGEVFGTPEYMAPERATSSDAGPPADLYALGVMLFEMLTQRLPFDAPSPAQILNKHMLEPPPRLAEHLPDAPPALDHLVYDLMAKVPDGRPVDAHRVLAALQEVSEAAQIPLPPELESSPIPPPRPSAATAAQRWSLRVEIVDRLVQKTYGGALPVEVTRTLEQMKAHVKELAELRTRGIEEQRALDTIHREWKEGRFRQGKAMDRLTADISRTREEARATRAGIAPLAGAARSFAPRVRAAHRDVVFWEGRSGFHEPYRELAAAYRTLADLVDLWTNARHAELEVEAAAVEKERAVAEVDQQIRELRHSLVIADRAMEDRKAKHFVALADVGRRAEKLELELLRSSGRLCAPLRGRADLAPFFAELAGAAPAAAALTP